MAKYVFAALAVSAALAQSTAAQNLSNPHGGGRW
jgi:hypothetical protein